ncbi:hypothetical protein MASR2M79_11520 [Aminivibrio sp.]
MVRPPEDMLTVAEAKEKLRRTIAMPQPSPPVLKFYNAARRRPAMILLGCLAFGIAMGSSRRARDLFFRMLERAIES